MMFGFGDDGMPLTETLDLMEVGILSPWPQDLQRRCHVTIPGLFYVGYCH